MSIEFTIQSITLQPEDLQEQFPNLISMLNSDLPQRKTHKRRKRKPKVTAGQLIEEIIAGIEK